MMLAEEQGVLACAPEGCGQYEFVQAGLGDMLSHLSHSLRVHSQLVID